MKHRVEFIVYLVGVMILGVALATLKQVLSTPVLLVGVFTYLIVLRVLGRYVQNRIASRTTHNDV